MKNLLLSALLSLLALGSALAQTRTVPAFHTIKVSGGIELTLTAGAAQRVEVSTEPAELAQYLTTTVEDGTLVLRFEHPNGNVRSQHLRVAVTADQLTALTASSGAAVTARGAFAASTFVLDASSGAAVRADLAISDLTVRQHGGSVVTLNGQVAKLLLDVNGGSVFSGNDLATTTCQAQANGGSIVRLNTKDSLTATADGGSSIKYHGSPQVTKQANGGSTIKGS
ncbi:head GIN domain-containing protein [Hymenobacter psoromatis]|uniref:head GIN domain-containing protein n=1 Tax=Hymenobacter psoromatis TaxID=1484116 RepID=UPI001CBA76E5|nr:head GIN domain-containing protein [Hymenobacter psoromatis]